MSKHAVSQPWVCCGRWRTRLCHRSRVESARDVRYDDYRSRDHQGGAPQDSRSILATSRRYDRRRRCRIAGRAATRTGGRDCRRGSFWGLSGDHRVRPRRLQVNAAYAWGNEARVPSLIAGCIALATDAPHYLRLSPRMAAGSGGGMTALGNFPGNVVAKVRCPLRQ